MPGRLIKLAERLRETLEREGTLSDARLKELLLKDEDEPLLDQALWFLAGRDEIMVDVATRAVHLRTYVSRKIMQILYREQSILIAEIAQKSGFGMATCCDVLGWLEREGRIDVDPDDRVSSLDSRPRG